MKSSRELDKEIAEKIMGLQDVQYREGTLYGAKHMFLEYGERTLGIGHQVPPYSLLMDDTWKIVDKLSSGELSGYGNRPIVLDLTYWPKEWRAEFKLMNDHAGDDRCHWIGRSVVASHAICIAALDFIND